MKSFDKLFIITILLLLVSCTREAADKKRTPLLEVEGKFLYLDDVQNIIPPNVNTADSAEIADSFQRKWITDVLIYQNARRNITNRAEIDRLIEEYRKSLIIHQYQQKLLASKLPKEPSEEELKTFYEQYGNQLQLKENIIKGIMLIVPQKAPQISSVRSWVQSGNEKALENIEKYSLRNAISYDYFADRWLSLTEVLKRIPVQIEQPATFVANNRFFETQDSTRHYFLRISDYRTTGQTEPFEMAREKISNLIMNKMKSQIISDFEKEIYEDAVKNGDINYFKK